MPVATSQGVGSHGRLATLATILAVILTISPLLVTAQDGGRPAAPVVTEPGVRGPAIIQTEAGIDPAVVAAENGIQTGFVYRNVANGFSANLTDANVAALQQDANVESISIDRIVSTNAVPNQLLRVGADTAASGGVGRGGDNSGVGIAIVDTGVGPNPDLNIAGGVDCTGNNSYSDSNGHGTHVAGIAAARDNADSTTGSAPGARIYSVRVLVGTTGSLSAVLCGLDWIAANPSGINVINLSLGLSQGPGVGCGQSTTFPLRQAVCDVRARGIQVVAAAGNLATNSANYSPASYPEVVAVSAYTDTDGRTGSRGASCSGGDDQFATYSNYNADIMAPGSCITSTAPGGGTSTKSGTSMAAPLVTGALAVNGGLGGISIPRSDSRGAVGSGDPMVLYLGDGAIPSGGSTVTATPTRAATSTAVPTRAATATATRPAATATRAAATATPFRRTRATATATIRPTATSYPSRVQRVRSQEATPTTVVSTASPSATSVRTRQARVAAQEVTATAQADQATTRAPRGVGQAAIGPTATPVLPTATAIPPTATPIPTEEPTLVPTAVPTDIPTQEATATPTQEATLVPTDLPTEIPTEEPTLVPTEIPVIMPADVTDTFFTGTGWIAVDDVPATTWYMEVPAPAISGAAPIEPTDEIGPPVDRSTEGLPVEGLPVEGVPVEDVPVDVPVAPITEPLDLALEIDLGYVQPVGSVRWQWTETIYAHGAEVQISLDGETWTTVAWPDTWNAIPGEWQEAAVGLDTRYVRFLFPNAEQLTVVGGLSEVEVLPLPVS